MRSRQVRLTSSLLGCIAFGAAAFLVYQTEQRLSMSRDALRNFDLRTRHAMLAFAEVRSSQQAYVAQGQDVATWSRKVAGLLETAATEVEYLRSAAESADARQALLDAGATIARLGTVDRRARDYIESGELLMAGDVVFTESVEATSEAIRLVGSAGVAESRQIDANEAAGRRRQAAVAAGAGGLGALILILLGLAPVSRENPESSVPISSIPAPPQPALPRGSAPVLKAAARLCTEFGRANDVQDLKRTLGETADVMDASGLIVWLGDRSGGDLRPVLAHGYSSHALARMSSVPRSADNAAAAAYRSGQLQIVLARPGSANGAVVAPLLSPDGCIGAFTAEILSGSETSDGVQALAALVAAQLASALASSAAADAAAADSQAATG